MSGLGKLPAAVSNSSSGALATKLGGMLALEEMVSCPICQDRYTNGGELLPKVLPVCFHTCCQGCLTTLLARDRELKCPMCRTPNGNRVPADQGGVGSLANNFTVLDLLSVVPPEDEIASLEKQLNEVKNSKKGWQTARPGSRAMIMGPAKALVSRNTLCSEHSGKELDVLCETCGIKICARCCLQVHRDHKLVVSAETAEKTKAQLQTIQSKSKERLASLRKAAIEVTEMNRRMNLRAETCRKGINDAIEEAMKVLEQRRKQLFGNLDQLQQGKSHVFTTQLERLERAVNLMNGGLGLAEKVTEEGTNEQLVVAKEILVENLQECLRVVRNADLVPRDDDDLVFTCEPTNISANIGSLGKMTSNTPFSGCSTAKGRGVEGAVVGKEAEFTIHLKNRLGESIQTSTNLISHLSVKIQNGARGNLIVPIIEDRKNGIFRVRYVPTSEGRCSISIFVKDEQLNESPFVIHVADKRDYETIRGPRYIFDGDRFDCPSGTCVDAYGTIYIADYNNNKVHVFPGGVSGGGVPIDHSSTLLLSSALPSSSSSSSSPSPPTSLSSTISSPILTSFSVPHPTSIEMDSKQNLVVACKDGLFRVYNPGTGVLLYQFGEKFSCNQPTGLAIDKRLQRIYVADYHNHRVLVLGPDGTFLWQLGNGQAGNQLGQFNHPFDISINTQGQLYVSDSWNHRVQVFNPDGSFVRVIGCTCGQQNGQFNFPRGLAIDSKNNLIVCDERNDRIQVFGEDGGFLAAITLSLALPFYVSVDSEDRLYVSEQRANRVQVF